MVEKVMHGAWVCRCGRKLAGCRCPEHQRMVVKVYPECIRCAPQPDTRPIKEKLGVREK